MDDGYDVPIRLIEYRVKQVELDFNALRVEVNAMRENQVTKRDFDALTKKIDAKSEFNFNFWLNSVTGPTISAIIVAVAVYFIITAHMPTAVAHP